VDANLAPLRRRPQRLLAAGCLAAVAATGPAAGRLHAVERGQTLEQLGRRYQVPVWALVQANGIERPDRIVAGTSLVVPVVPRKAARPAPVAVPAAAPAPVPAAAPRSPGAGRGPTLRIPADRARLRPVFLRYSREAGLPADLVMALAWQESGWQSRKVSSTGAVGVMQLMPDTVEFVSLMLLRASRALDARDPVVNIRLGTRFLRYLLDRSGGDVEAALASYYQGLRSVRDHAALPETRRFVANVKALRPRLL
jgi:soluble lytic murein transglycosylase-like protein